MGFKCDRTSCLLCDIIIATCETTKFLHMTYMYNFPRRKKGEEKRIIIIPSYRDARFSSWKSCSERDSRENLRCTISGSHAAGAGYELKDARTYDSQDQRTLGLQYFRAVLSSAPRVRPTKIVASLVNVSWSQTLENI